MLAGGPIGPANPNKSKVIRSGVEILDPDEVEAAIIRGVTLDQMNLRAGDQIMVDPGARKGPVWRTVLAVAGAVSSVAFLVLRVF
jgi:hypothetical protein